MIFDAIVALLIWKIFGETGLWVLGITCAITILRTCANINDFMQIMEEVTIECEEENYDK